MTQLTREDLAGMSPAEIVAAREQGRLAALLGEPPATVAAADKARDGQPLTRTDLAELARAGKYDIIVAAKDGGQITYEGDRS